MSIKVRQAIENSLISIQQNTFDENTIRTLLISTREYLRPDSLLRELAHFIAHPNRNQGIFHKKVNSRYAKFKLVSDQVSKFDLSHFKENISTEDELSDFMLAGINVDKIEAKLFKVLYQDGLDDLPEEHLLKYTGFNKFEVSNLLNEHYTKIENYYYLKVIKTERMISRLKQLPPDDQLNKAIQEGLTLTSRIRNRIDGIQKVIRGAIFFHSVFEKDSITKEFQNYYAEVLDRFEIDRKYVDVLKDNIDSILLCLITLLHDSKFVFYDKNESRVSLCLYLEDKMSATNADNKKPKSDLLYENGVLALYLACDTGGGEQISFPLFVSDLKIQEYITKPNFLKGGILDSYNEIPWITAIRNGGKIELI